MCRTKKFEPKNYERNEHKSAKPYKREKYRTKLYDDE